MKNCHFFGASARCPRTAQQRREDETAGVILAMFFTLPAFAFGFALGTFACWAGWI